MRRKCADVVPALRTGSTKCVLSHRCVIVGVLEEPVDSLSSAAVTAMNYLPLLLVHRDLSARMCMCECVHVCVCVLGRCGGVTLSLKHSGQGLCECFCAMLGGRKHGALLHLASVSSRRLTLISRGSEGWWFSIK